MHVLLSPFILFIHSIALAGALVVTSADGTQIFTEATGKSTNPHVVLTAGLSLSESVYHDFLRNPIVANSLYVVRYDIRGHGQSGKPTDPAAYESKRFAEDFQAVSKAYKLKRPVFAGWSMGSAVITDIVTSLPPASISAGFYISGIPATGDIIGQLANPGLVEALPGLLSTTDVNAYRNSSFIFVDKLFSKPKSVPWSVRTEFLGNSLSPAVMNLSLNRQMNVEKLFSAGQAGLPLFSIQGDRDGHRIGAPKHVDDIVRPHFRIYKSLHLPGIGHAVHYEAPDALAFTLVYWAKKYSGKDYTKKESQESKDDFSDLLDLINGLL